jgi:hypothetical protein
MIPTTGDDSSSSGGSGGGTTPKDNTFYVVTLTLNVRKNPTTDQADLIPGAQLRMGEKVTVDPNSRKDDGTYVWWKHDKGGWSAEKTSNNSEVYLSKSGADLPPSDFVFTRSPMDLSVMRWFYYYGNTVYAYIYGRGHNYDGYSQGLHGGLDYGHPGQPDTVPVFAGVHGKFDYAGSGRAFGPNRVDVLVGNYLIIYGHLANPNPNGLRQGASVTPDTVLGFIDRGAKHFHLEIRKSGYLYNPLLFMPNEMREAIFKKFPPVGDFAFYKSDRWTQWTTPLDQPVIKLGGPVIGPRG